MDILNLMACSPLDPAAYSEEPGTPPGGAPRRGFTSFPGGRVEIGAGHDGFAFDNERPAHPVLTAPYRLANDLVTAGEWMVFIEDGGYARPDLWLSDGWACVRRDDWAAPLYWRREGGRWMTMSLAGLRPVDPDEPVRHISYYEADAFARWRGARLPTEAEWENAAASGPDLSRMHGAVWQWTAAAYGPYPGFRPTEGAASEYNGKFMANQMVLRGSSFATPDGHARDTYRNFFYPHQRWAFTGVRLAADPAPDQGGEGDADPFAAALRQGLVRPQKSVEPKWFYDAEGSRLFEQITTLPEYYPTRQETALLRGLAQRLAADFGPGATLVEFGSGASEKTRLLLDASPGLAAYVPIDISPDALADAAARIDAAYPDLRVQPVVGDFLHLDSLPIETGAGRRIGFFPGSTIGNLPPQEAVDFLAGARRLLGPGAMFILGVDLIKDPAVLIAAYDDAVGVTAAFNCNLLTRANRELDADFDLTGFDHRAVWNAADSRMEMHLVSNRDQTVHIGGQTFTFHAGETIHTESSRKFSEGSVRLLARESGWTMIDLFISPEPSVAIAVLTT